MAVVTDARGRRAQRYRAALPLVRTVAAAVLLVAWETAARQRWIDEFFFGSPSGVAAVLWRWAADGMIYPHILTTLKEALGGLALGVLVGTVLGFLLAHHRALGDLLEPVLVMANAIPRIIFAPLLVLWFGIGAGSKIALSFLLVFFVIVFAVMTGLREVDAHLVEGVRILGAGRYGVIRHVYVPSVLAWLFGSLKVAVGLAFTGAVVGEFLGAGRGLGYLISVGQNTYDASIVLAGIAVIAGLILLIFSVLRMVEERVSRWKRGPAS
jgi:NitT/TauT family transport system permease protein